MAIFSHDTLGLGHLQRCLNISGALTERFPELSILLLTGSPAVNRYSLPKRVDYIKLPSVRKVGNERYEARSLGLSDAGVLDLRRNLALRAIQGFNPHVLLVDHAPLGMGGEMRPALEWLRKNRPHCINVLGMRDVLDAPDAVIEHWTKEGTYDVLRDLYDQILVYGSPDIFDTISAYRFPDDLRAKSRYCQYVRELGCEESREDVDVHLRGDRPVVVVTIGGGDGGGEVILGSYLEMLRRFEKEIGFESILLPGPFLPRALRDRFRTEIDGLPATILDFVPSTSPYMERADLVVCTGGYNTITQLLSVGKKAIVIPRIMHRQEQGMRARLLAEMGLITLLHPDDVTVEQLHETVTTHLSDPALPLVAAREQSLLPLDGTKMIAEFCRGLTITDSFGNGTNPS